MFRIKSFGIFILVAALVIMCGCSSGGSPVLPDTNTGTLGGGFSLPQKDSDTTQNDQEPSRVIWGIYSLTFDPVRQEVTATPLKTGDKHYNVTAYVTPPACPNCLGITVIAYHPAGWVYDCDVSLMNPTQLTAYDVRGTLLIGGPTDKRKLVNADEYTTLFDASTPPNKNPFMAFATDQPGRKFLPKAIHKTLYKVSIPPPPNYNVLYVIDASWPNNQREPYKIYNQEVTGVIDDAGVGSGTVVIWVSDWQGDVESVKLDITALGAPAPLELQHVYGDKWQADLKDEWAPAGDYKLWIEAKSVGNDLILYDILNLTIVPYINNPPVWDTTVGIVSALPGDKKVLVTYGTATDPQMPITYVVYYSETTPINFATASKVESTTGSPTLVPGLANGKTYHFAVRARDAFTLEDSNTNELPATPQYENLPPVWDDTVGITGVTPGDGKVVVTYGTASDPDMPITYVVYYSDITPIDFGTASSVESTTGSPTTVDGLTNWKPYYFAVRARDALGLEDSNTNELPATPHDGNEPPYWDGLVGVQSLTPLSQAMEVGFGSASDPDLPVTYNIYYSETTPIDFGTAPSVNVAASPGVVGSLDNAKIYHFAVRAMDGTGLEDNNTVELAGCPNLPPEWDVAVGVQTLKALSGSVEVGFGTASDVDAPVTYNVYYSETTPIDFATAFEINVASAPAVVGGLSNGKTYYFAVRAKDGLGLEEDNIVELSKCPNLPPTWIMTVGVQSLLPASHAMQVQFGLAIDPDVPVKYNVYCSETSPIDFGTAPKINVAFPPAYVIGLSNALTYHFAVRAVDNYGLEDQNTVELAGCPNLPPAWSGTVGIISASGGFDFAKLFFGSATDPDTPVTYNIYYSKTTPINFSTADKITGVTSSPYTVKPLDHDQLYHFAVRAQDGYGLEDTNKKEASAYVWRLPELRWSRPFGASVFASPNYADVDGNGVKDIIIGGWNNQVRALDGDGGGTLWTSYAGDWLFSSPAIGPVGGSDIPDVLVGCYDKKLYAINGEDGSGLWDFPTNGVISSSPAIGDIDGGDDLEVAFGSHDYYLYVVRLTTGAQVWKKITGGSIVSSPAIYDFDGDSDMDVVVGSGSGNLFCFDGLDGTVKWVFPTAGAINSSPAIGDINNDGQREIVVGSLDGNVYAVNTQGKQVWSFPVGGYIWSSPALGDVNGDGSLDVAIGADNTNFYLIDGKTGGEIWTFPSGNRIWSSPSLVDMTGDGVLDVLVGSDDNYLWCLDGTDGGVLWNYSTGWMVDSSPAVVDLDGDGYLEVVFGSFDGSVYCIDSHAAVPGGSGYSWPKFRKSTDNKGSI